MNFLKTAMAASGQFIVALSLPHFPENEADGKIKGQIQQHSLKGELFPESASFHAPTLYTELVR